MSATYRWEWRQIFWPTPFTPDQAFALLERIASDRRLGTVVFEARSTNGKITYFVAVHPHHVTPTTQLLRSLVHGTRVVEPKSQARPVVKRSGRVRVSSRHLALNIDRVTATTRSVLAGLAATGKDESVVLQVMLGGRLAPRFIPPKLPDPQQYWFDVLVSGAKEASTDTRNSLKVRSSTHGFKASIRIGASAPTPGRIAALMAVTLGGLRTAEAAGVRVNYRTETTSKLTQTVAPWLWPIRISSRELTTLMGWPVDTDSETPLPGQPNKHPRALAPAMPLLETRRPFAQTTAPGVDEQVGITATDSLFHTVLTGPTGSGKSTAMLAMILDAIRDGRGVLVIDPKTDLVNDVLARMPESRKDDVVVIDPTSARPIGLNPLRTRSREAGLVADALVAVFKDLSGDSWGPRTQDVMNAALLTLAHHKDATLLMLPALLTDDRFRRKVLRSVNDHFGLGSFWATYEAMSPQQRDQVIAPTMTRLRQFLYRPQLRAVLGQAEPRFDLEDIFTRRRIVLVSLNRGQLGSESARLLGSLIVSQLWPLILRRASLPPERRYVTNVFIDEVAEFLRLPTDLEDALSQSRGLGVGWTMAHQYRRQLPKPLLAGIDANARNKVLFGTTGEDAADLARLASELEPDDLKFLPTYEVYLNLMQHGHSSGWFSGKTLAPEPVSGDAIELRVRSADLYGRDAAEVEREAFTAIGIDPDSSAPLTDPDEPIGRRKADGGQS